MAFPITPNVPMERKKDYLASFLPTIRTYGTHLSLFTFHRNASWVEE